MNDERSDTRRTTSTRRKNPVVGAEKIIIRIQIRNRPRIAGRSARSDVRTSHPMMIVKRSPGRSAKRTRRVVNLKMKLLRTSPGFSPSVPLGY
jgi:hypothetical protein